MTRKQRRRAWGSITEAKRGKKCILRWQENTPCGRKRKTKTVYGTYREACTELDRIHVERANDNPVPTIAQAYGTWLEPSMEALVAAGTLAPNTRNLVTRSWANYVGPTCGTMPVDQLRPVHLQEWLLTLSAATADTAGCPYISICNSWQVIWVLTVTDQDVGWGKILLLRGRDSSVSICNS